VATTLIFPAYAEEKKIKRKTTIANFRFIIIF